MKQVICFKIPIIFCIGGKNYFSQPLHVHGVSDVGKMEIYTAE
jgi:hypothetical protein